MTACAASGRAHDAASTCPSLLWSVWPMKRPASLLTLRTGSLAAEASPFVAAFSAGSPGIWEGEGQGLPFRAGALGSLSLRLLCSPRAQRGHSGGCLWHLCPAATLPLCHLPGQPAPHTHRNPEASEAASAPVKGPLADFYSWIIPWNWLWLGG